MQNGFVESFNGRMRDELLNEALFFGLEHARHAIAECTEDYNTDPPYSALDYQHRWPLPPNSPQQAITLRSLEAPRAGLLFTLPERAYSCRDSNPRWRILQWQASPSGSRGLNQVRQVPKASS